MRKALEALAFLSLLLLWSLSVVSIPFIPEKCVVCGRQSNHNPSETLRSLSVMEWAFNAVPSCHFSCFKNYDASKHNPNGGL